MSQPHATVLVAVSCGSISCSGQLTSINEDAIVGFVSASLIADELQVENLAVEVGPRGHRLGLRLMSGMLIKYGLPFMAPDDTYYDRTSLQVQDQTQARVCLLEVKDGNTTAIQLYSKLGFREVGRRENYYPDGKACVLMLMSR